MIKVVLADDHEMVRAGFKMLLEQNGNYKVVGEAAEGGQAYELVSRERPDVLLLDVSMPPGRSGISACEDIARDFPQTKVLVVTMYADPEYLYYTLRGGASGYMLKNSSYEELDRAIKSVLEGSIFIHPKMREMLGSNLSPQKAESLAKAQQLTTRELEITRLLAHGYTNKEIAEKLFLSIKTIEAHRSKIYSKLGLKSRAELVDYAIEHNLMAL